MSTIIPAILPQSREDLEQKLSQLVGGADAVQIDMVDGRFVPYKSWPYNQASKDAPPVFADGEMLPYLDKLQYEMDLMVSDPEEITGRWIDAGAARITLHAESTKYLPDAITHLQVKYGHAKDFVPGLLSLGLALNINTELSLIEPYLEHTDYVQFMGIAKIGQQGEPFDSRVIRKIEEFKKKYPDMVIQVDGGVTLDTARVLLNAGVDRLIIGSALWKAPNLAEEIKKFHRLAQEYSE